VLAAGGCGASSGESKTIYFWNNLVGDDGPAMQRIVKEYNAQSDYKVVFQPMNGGDLTTKIYSVMQTGKNIPDIIIGDQFQTAVLQSQGLLDTMDDWQKVAPDLKESSFLPATWLGKAPQPGKMPGCRHCFLPFPQRTIAGPLLVAIRMGRILFD